MNLNYCKKDVLQDFKDYYFEILKIKLKTSQSYKNVCGSNNMYILVT